MSKIVLKAAMQNENASGAYCWTNDRIMNLEMLLEMGTMGARHATTALSKIVREDISVEVPRLHTAPPHLIPKIYDRHDQLTTVVYMQLKSQDCDIMLAFETEEAKKIAALMTMASPEEMDPEMEKSAMEELGSIMICYFLSAIANLAGVGLVPTSPQLITDTFDAIIDNFLAKQALVSDVALIFDTCFKRNSSSAEGTLLVFPSLELQELFVTKGKEWISNSRKGVFKVL